MPRRHWFLDFVIQLLVSTVGSFFIAVFISIVSAMLTAALSRNTSGGNFMDHVVNQPTFALLDPPYYTGPVFAGLALGFLSHRVYPSRVAAWVWTIPTIVLVWNMLTWRNGGYRPYWHDVWANYFSSECSSSECLYQIFVTVPFYSSVAYTFGWLARSSFPKRRTM